MLLDTSAIPLMHAIGVVIFTCRLLLYAYLYIYILYLFKYNRPLERIRGPFNLFLNLFFLKLKTYYYLTVYLFILFRLIIFSNYTNIIIFHQILIVFHLFTVFLNIYS